ncbi:hypothetical protein ABLV31_17845 [Klebsiella sp. CN_Kp118]|uniref:hypothetical protein n=1 Tax=Klebsiella sp. CN_Kp118 TaxID=3153432 RepID=UPI0032B51433
MNREYNNTYFIFLVFLSLFGVVFNTAWVLIKLASNDWYIDITEANFIDAASIIVLIVFSVMLFINDRKILKDIGAYCPSWGWYFIIPVYVYLRQKKNNLGLKYFWIYMISTFIVTKLAQSLATQILIGLINIK